ncbi:receptor-like protein 12 [Dorcoceras hygrometricum]|uniref:Receptor-like protein 12 n=1 Tax=Dorcoceras hygrometricum TaxID=472368 RepID=A0A2Z7A4L8_9LAMI|nr:receptor-like protein 12 [Dorcoceras hygrometricum]
MKCAACLDRSRHEDIQSGTVRGRLSWIGRRYLAGTEQTKNQQVKDKPAGQYLQGQIVKEDLSSKDDEAFLDWSRREDIQAWTVKGRLCWTGRIYQAGTGQIVKEDLSSEDDEGQLERRSAYKSKLEKLLKSGCKREEKKRSLNSMKEQPARTKTSSK